MIEEILVSPSNELAGASEGLVLDIIVYGEWIQKVASLKSGSIIVLKNIHYLLPRSGSISLTFHQGSKCDRNIYVLDENTNAQSHYVYVALRNTLDSIINSWYGQQQLENIDNEQRLNDTSENIQEDISGVAASHPHTCQTNEMSEEDDQHVERAQTPLLEALEHSVPVSLEKTVKMESTRVISPVSLPQAEFGSPSKPLVQDEAVDVITPKKNVPPVNDDDETVEDMLAYVFGQWYLCSISKFNVYLDFPCHISCLIFLRMVILEHSLFLIK
uniref:POT1PC domain-containing protein n=1 Tax=Heterorhabditis bacteriophora TaxID=37862 RepID=A0A1I7WHX1_HETBA